MKGKTILIIAGLLIIAMAGWAILRPAATANAVYDPADIQEGYRTKGDPDAKVKIIEYSDFQCPYCVRFYSDTEGQIMSEYVDTGEASFEFRHFPLNFHEHAEKAAEAAECAADQGDFWGMHDMIYSNGVGKGSSTFKAYAKDLGLNEDLFANCLDSGAMKLRVAEDIVSGRSAGITGTPSFLINGKLITGARPIDDFRQAIDDALNS